MHKNGNNANIDSRGFTTKNVTPSGNRTWASHNLRFQVQHSPFYTNLSCATQEIFKLLFMQHLILDFEVLRGFSYNQ